MKNRSKKNPTKHTLTFIVILSVVLNFQVISQNVKLDSTFANNGILSISSPTQCPKSELFTLDVDNDNNIYGLAYAWETSAQVSLMLTKTNSNGILNNQFGNNGIAIFNNLRGTIGIKVLANSKILLFGAIKTTTNNVFALLLRLNSNGSVDQTFGNNGFIMYPSNMAYECIDVLELPDQSIILSCVTNSGSSYTSSLIKINANGQLNTQYGNNGIVTIGNANNQFVIYNTILTTAGTIMSIGYDYLNYDPMTIPNLGFYCSTNMQGNFITSFGNNGIITNVPGGIIQNAPNNSFYIGFGPKPIIKIKSDGSLDQTFGNNGVANISPLTSLSHFDVQNDGKVIFILKTIEPNNNQVISVLRLNLNGKNDSTFNFGNPFKIDFHPTNNELVHCIKYKAPRTVYIGGVNYDFSTNFSKSTIVKLKLLDTSLGINENNNSTNLSIYPTPFTNQLFVSNMQDVKTLQLFDVLGKELKLEIIGNTVNTEANLQSGLYFLKAQFKNGASVMQKILRE